MSTNFERGVSIGFPIPRVYATNKFIRILSQQAVDESDDDRQSEATIRKSPGKLSKSQTEFDKTEKRRKKEEREKAYKEKLKKLEEEKRLFAEAKKYKNEVDFVNYRLDFSIPSTGNEY